MFGILEEVYSMCRCIEKNIDIVNYTSEIDTIGITPIIAPDDAINKGLWKEYKQVSLGYRFANISLSIDYADYVSSGISRKKHLIIENILKSLFLIKQHLGKNFDYEAIEKDMLDLLHDKNFI